MERRDQLEHARRVFFDPGDLEAEPAFASTLSTLASTGLQWGGLLGLLGLLVHVPVNVFLLGRPVAAWDPAAPAPEVFVLWDEAVVALLCGAAVWVGRSGGALSRIRTAGLVLTIAVVAVSLVADAYRGVLRVEYVILPYLLAVAVIPYRPWQALLLGGMLTTLLAGVGHYGVSGAAVGPAVVGAGALVGMGFVTVVTTGIATVLYAVRYRQHRARREAETLHEQVARLERAKSRFFADLSYELRTPLTLILGPLREVLEERRGTVPDDLREQLAGAEGQAHRMKRLVDQLFDLASLDEGDLMLSLQRHDLGAVVTAAVPPLRRWAEEKGVAFRLDVPTDAPEAWVDADRLTHVLTTLLANAIRYTPEDGTVRVQVQQAGGAAEISIRDTGPGLPQPLQDRIFGRSESYIPLGGEGTSGEEAGTTAQRLGMGIGLAHAYALVQRHGGDVQVESEPGFGTELTVRLPLGREHVSERDVVEKDPAEPYTAPAMPLTTRLGEAEDAPDERDTADADADAPTVLVVDDDVDMQAYLRRLLGRHYRVDAAGDLDEALARLHEEDVDLVLGETGAPGTSGGALCRAVRDDDQLRHLPVLLLTAQPQNAARRSELEVGADAYVPMPFDPAELAARVENLIDIRRLVQTRGPVPDWLGPAETPSSSEDVAFLDALNDVVDEHIDNSNFGVDWLADEVDLSARHLRRRIKEATGLSAAGFIRARRLYHAAALLQEDTPTVADLAAAVGYRDPSYFSRLFRETFGCSPTEYAEQAPAAPDGPDIAA